MAPIVALLLAASSPSWSVAITRTVGLSPDSAMQLAEGFARAVDAQSSPVLGKQIAPRVFAVTLGSKAADPLVCAGSAECGAGLGQVGAVDWLFTLALARVGGKLIVDVALIDVRGKKALAQLTEAVSYAYPDESIAALAPRLVEQLPSPQPAVEERAPEVPIVQTGAPEPAPEKGRSWALPIAAGGAGLALLGGGTYFALESKKASDQVDALTRTAGSTFGPEQQRLESWGQTSNNLAVATFAAGSAALLIGAGVIAFGADEGAPVAVYGGPGGVGLSGRF